MSGKFQIITRPKKELIKRAKIFEGITFWARSIKGGAPIRVLIIPQLFDDVNGKPFDASKIKVGGIYEMVLKKEKTTDCIKHQYAVVVEITF